MNAGGFHQPVAALCSRRTWIQGHAVGVLSRINRLLSPYARVALTHSVFQEKISKCWCDPGVQISVWEVRGRPARHQIVCSCTLCAGSVGLALQHGDPTTAWGCLLGAQHTTGPWCLKWGLIIRDTTGYPASKQRPLMVSLTSVSCSCCWSLHHPAKSFSNEESQWSLEVFILATVTPYDVQTCINIILSWCFLS